MRAVVYMAGGDKAVYSGDLVSEDDVCIAMTRVGLWLDRADYCDYCEADATYDRVEITTAAIASVCYPDASAAQQTFDFTGAS